MARTQSPAASAEVKTYSSRPILRIAVRVSAVATLGVVLANCAGPQQQSRYSSQQQREFGSFSHSKYGTASPRVYADTGAALPKGGGRDHIGKAYSVAGRRYVPHDRPVGSSQVGMASWYGAAFHGRKTANGEVYDRRSFTAAHPTMPLPSYARVTNLRNNYSVIVRVNDRGPYHGGRIMDVSERVADTLAFKGQGTGRIKVDYLGRAGIGGSDDVRLAQSLTMDGRPAVASYIPASYGENRGTTQVAAAEPAPTPAATPAVTVAAPAAATAMVATAPRAPQPQPQVAVQSSKTSVTTVTTSTASTTNAAKAATSAAQPAAAQPAAQANGRSAAMAAAAAIAQKNEGKNMQALDPSKAPRPAVRPVNLGPIPGAKEDKAGNGRLSAAPKVGDKPAIIASAKANAKEAMTKATAKKASKMAALD